MVALWRVRRCRDCECGAGGRAKKDDNHHIVLAAEKIRHARASKDPTYDEPNVVINDYFIHEFSNSLSYLVSLLESIPEEEEEEDM